MTSWKENPIVTEYPQSSYSQSSETTVANSPVQLALVILPLGLIAGTLLGFVADWVVSLPWVPLEGPFRLVQRIPSPYDIVAPAAVGLVGGIVLLMVALEDRMVVRVSDYRMAARRKSFLRELPRQSIGNVFLDEKQLVVLDRRGAERLRFRIDNDERKNLEKAFCAYGYPWSGDGDPYREQFRRWVPGMPELPAGADALLRAREKALEKDDGPEIAELHGELAKLGVAVREQDKRQYWRPQPAE